MERCNLREQLLDCRGHALVIGGPGSGKTTIALKKAVVRINEGLAPGQSVLFLSFSRAAVARMGEQAVVDLTVLSGTYVMVSMLLNATQVGIPGGGAEPLQVLSPLEIRQRLLA